MGRIAARPRKPRLTRNNGRCEYVSRLFLNMLKMKCDKHNSDFQSNFLTCIVYWASSDAIRTMPLSASQ